MKLQRSVFFGRSGAEDLFDNDQSLPDMETYHESVCSDTWRLDRVRYRFKWDDCARKVA